MRAPMKIIYEPPQRTILVRGADSYAGRALCELLARDGALRVIGYDRYAGQALPAERGNIRWMAGADADEAALAAALAEEQVDTLVDLAEHAAAPVAAVLRYGDALVDHDRDRFRFVMVRPFAGALPPPPIAGVPVVQAQTATLYGPGAPDDTLIPRALRAALAGTPILVEDNGLTSCDWLHVEDHARAVQTVLLRGLPGAPYQISARVRRTTLSTVALICDLLDRMAPRADGRKHRALICFGAHPRPIAHRPAIDPTRIEQELGWRAQIGFVEGLIDIIARGLIAVPPANGARIHS